MKRIIGALGGRVDEESGNIYGEHDTEWGSGREALGDYLQVDVAGFCQCGRPEDNLMYIMRGLESINDPFLDDHTPAEWHDYYQGLEARRKELFKTDEAEYFFYYWADREGLSEHGGSVPGWLTERGHLFLDALRIWEGMEEDDEANR